jgi:hypothetical protein
LKGNIPGYLFAWRETARWDGRAHIDLPYLGDPDALHLFLEKLSKVIEEGISVTVPVPSEYIILPPFLSQIFG